MSSDVIRLGAVAYDPKVVTIWNGFRTLLRADGVEMDYVLYSNYERQVEDLVAGRVDLAWNSPLAWVRARRLAAQQNVTVRAVAMRDTDRDLHSVLVVRADSGIDSVEQLRGRRVGLGAVDSPQATLLPMSLLRASGLGDDEVTWQRHDVGVGLHGDHIGGERDAALALRHGRVDAAWMIDSNLLLFGQEGTLPAGSTSVVAETVAYDHCNMTAGPSADPALVEAFTAALFGMSYADPVARPLLDLEGLKQWLPGRVEGYRALEAAVDESGFYDRAGGLGAGDYRP